MAAERSRRGNAGAKMSGLLDKEEEDEFYKTTYDDKDKNDDPKSDPEDEETARKKVKVCRLSKTLLLFLIS